jgi:hypothetical protein
MMKGKAYSRCKLNRVSSYALTGYPREGSELGAFQVGYVYTCPLSVNVPFYDPFYP